MTPTLTNTAETAVLAMHILVARLSWTRTATSSSPATLLQRRAVLGGSSTGLTSGKPAPWRRERRGRRGYQTTNSICQQESVNSTRNALRMAREAERRPQHIGPSRGSIGFVALNPIVVSLSLMYTCRETGEHRASSRCVQGTLSACG